MAEKRQYGQFCGLASALDIIGERWSILVVRELLINPARFNDLMDNLPGISPNMLAERLRSLANHKIIEVEPVPGDGRGKLYRLTALGMELRAPVYGLARWGMGFLTEDDAAQSTSRAAWGFLAIQAMVEAENLPGVDEEYEFRVDDEVFCIRVHGGKATAQRGAAANPALVIRTDAETFIRIGARLLSPFEAVFTGRVAAEGDAAAIQRCAHLLGLDKPSRAVA